MSEKVLAGKPALLKTAAVFAGIAAAVALPQIFHWIGAASGLGTAPGAAFLPMHLPVFIVGFLAGPLAGFAVGALSPLLSFAISGMPLLAALPFMMIELAGYGLAGGLLQKSKMPVFFKLLTAQIAGRVLRAGAVLLAVYAFSSTTVPVASIWTGIVAGLPGILLQWVFVPLLMFWITKSGFAVKKGA